MNTQAHRTAPSLFREAGIALAVLALYLLTLLLPLHQAAGLQRDLNAAGFSTLDTWSICQPLAQDDNGDPREAAALKCPATGVGKQQIAAVQPPVLVIDPPTTSALVHFAQVPGAYRPLLPDHVGQSRAPPVTA